MKKFSIAAVFFLFAMSAFAQEGWRDAQGHPAPNTDFRKSQNGFGGWLLVTSDADWLAKWDTPSETAPNFNEAKTVARGNKVFVLTFFSNPKLNDAKSADVSCDIDIVRPNGTSSIHQLDTVCFKGVLKGNPLNMYLSAPILNFVGEPDDPAGEWLVSITLKDNIRHVSLPLKTSFVLR